MRKKMNALTLRAKNTAMNLMVKKDKGIETIMQIALVCVISVSVAAMFRTESGNLIGTVMDTMNTNITDTLFKEFVVV